VDHCAGERGARGEKGGSGEREERGRGLGGVVAGKSEDGLQKWEGATESARERGEGVGEKTG